MENKKNLLWAPEIIKESNGIACGDTLSISAYRTENRLYFRFDGDACKVATKVADYLMDSFSGKYECEILENVERLKIGQYNEDEHWLVELSIKRKSCVESPINLLYEILGENLSGEIDIRGQSILACDACVSTKPINWKLDIKDSKKCGLRDIYNKLKTMDNPVESELQKLGLCFLSEKEQARFSIRLSQVSDKDFKLIKKLRLAVLLFNNAIQYNLTLDKKIEELAVKQIVSLNVANEEIKTVNEFIWKNKLQIDAVKGGKTNKFYPEGCYRTHMDFDYLAAKFDDAFKLISYLINERQFKLVIGGSVPFSLKALLNTDKEEVLTGHIHLEKILQNKYQVVIDVNMGGFPLGRTGIIQCNKDGKIELEDLICITVSHLFKHEHAFMKDINDLYYLLSFEGLDKDLLVNKLKKYKLVNLFMIVYKFLRKELLLNTEVDIEDTVEFSKKRLDLWPMSRLSHFYIKAKDMYELNINQFGEVDGLQESINQICDGTGKIETKKYCELTSNLNERVYLYPIVIFNRYIINLEMEDLINIETGIFRKGQILILPIGFFLIQDNIYPDFSRNKLNSQIDNLLYKLGLSDSVCKLDYVMEARKDTWLY